MTAEKTSIGDHVSVGVHEKVRPDADPGANLRQGSGLELLAEARRRIEAHCLPLRQRLAVAQSEGRPIEPDVLAAVRAYRDAIATLMDMERQLT